MKTYPFDCVIVQNVEGEAEPDDESDVPDRYDFEYEAGYQATECLDRDYFFYDPNKQGVSVVLHRRLAEHDSIAPVGRSEIREIARQLSNNRLSKSNAVRALMKLADREEEKEVLSVGLKD